MDPSRQSILEQKRQRLQELRQRRLNADTEAGSNASVNVSIAEPIEPPQDDKSLTKQTVKIDASVQVKKFKEITKFNKSIQTDRIKPVSVGEEIAAPEPIDEKPFKVAIEENFNETRLNQLLESSIILLHEVITTEEPIELANGDDSVSLVTECITDSVPIRIDCFEDLIGVMFDTTIIIYTNKKLVPIKILHSITSIAHIRFVNRFKIVGGLKNGKVVVWNMQEDDELLSSPPSYTHKLLHEDRITSINIIESMVVTTSHDRINFWSVNFLAYPQYSIQLPSELTKPICINDLVIVGEAISVEKYIDQIIISEANTGIQKLINNVKSNYVESTIDSQSVKSLVMIGLKNDSPILCGVCHDFNIYVYNKSTKILNIDTDYMVLGILAKPNLNFQFVSFGEKLDGSGIVEVWDLTKDVNYALVSLQINDIMCVGFSNDNLVVGTKDKLSIYKVEMSGDVKYSIHDVI